MSWQALGGPPKLPKEVAQALAGGSVPAKRSPAFGGIRRSTPDLTFEPQTAIEEKARLRAMFGRRADHLHVEDEPKCAAPAPAPAAPQVPQQPGPPSRRSGRRVGGTTQKATQSELAQSVSGENAALRIASEGLALQSVNDITPIAASMPLVPRVATGTATGQCAGSALGAEDVNTHSGRISSASPTSVHRARVWSVEVEDAFRLQLAGYRDLQAIPSFRHPRPITTPTRPSLTPSSTTLRLIRSAYFSLDLCEALSLAPVALQELLLLGEPPPERWASHPPFIKKLCSRESLGVTSPPRFPSCGHQGAGG